MSRKWRPGKAQAKAFAEQMDRIKKFCDEHGIQYSRTMDSYYFEHQGKKYRVSNHSVEASNRSAYDDLSGEQIRELYHEDGRECGTIYIHASKTRIIEIYNDLASGYTLDGRGRRKTAKGQ